MLKVLVTGGGTAGHINPAMAIIDIIREKYVVSDKPKKREVSFLYAGTPDSLEERLAKAADLDFAPIRVMGIQRRLTLKNIQRNVKAVACLMTAGSKARKIIKGFQPDLVIGTGGYVSGPIMLEATKMGIPTVIHEQNAFPGVTTKILAPKVSKVMLTVEKARKRLDESSDCVVTGLPIRSIIGKISKQEARKRLGLDDNFCILSFGGSLGAGGINKAANDLIIWHKLKSPSDINHIHGYGGMGRDTFLPSLKNAGVDIDNKRLVIKEYIDISVCMAAADLVICRSGASTLCELQAMGKPSILIPSPVVTENHQYHNAMVLADAGGAIVIEEKDVNPQQIASIVNDFKNNLDKLHTYADKTASLYLPDVPERIWQVIQPLIPNAKK